MNIDEIIPQLLEWWDNDQIKQGFMLVDVTAIGDNETQTTPVLGVSRDVKLPPLSTLYELKHQGLIEIEETRTSQGNAAWKVYMLPKLRTWSVVENSVEDQGPDMLEASDKRKVFVVHGRNMAIRDSVFGFLRSIGLAPIEWSEAIALTGSGTPYIGQVLDVAFDHAQAVVVVMTPDDEVHLREELWNDNELEDEKTARYQPRPNVLFEAGMAFGRNPDRTILIEIGNVKRYSDVDGRHRVRMTGSPESRNDLVSRLRNAGCTVDTENKNDWLTTGNFNINF